MIAPISPESANGSSLRAADITVHLGEKQVLAGVSLQIDPGRLVAVVGPNGSGKTTLLRALAGLVDCTLGGITLASTGLHRLGRRTIARQIAYLPQQWAVAFPLTCLELVLLGRSPHKRWLGLADREDLLLAREAMDTLEVWDLADRPITAVSGGELQRLVFARALVQRCRFLLLDEPTSAQDPRGVLTIMQVLGGQRDSGTGILAAVHDLNLALRFFDQLLVMKEGRIIGRGEPGQVLDSGALQEAFEVDLERIGEPGSSLVLAGLKPDPRR